MAGEWAREALIRLGVVSATNTVLSGIVEVRCDGDLSVATEAYGGRLLLTRQWREERGLWCLRDAASLVGDEAPAPGEIESIASVLPLQLAYQRASDPLAAGLDGARETPWTDADCLIDVGYALKSRDNFERLVLPLEADLRRLGVRRVAIGGTRKVTEELKLLPPDRQIGQTGVRVQPAVLLALGVSGAPQHVDYISDRTTIFAFNRDADAPLMTLNRRRALPKVYPVLGDLFETLPAVLTALRSR